MKNAVNEQEKRDKYVRIATHVIQELRRLGVTAEELEKLVRMAIAEVNEDMWKELKAKAKE